MNKIPSFSDLNMRLHEIPVENDDFYHKNCIFVPKIAKSYV